MGFALGNWIGNLRMTGRDKTPENRVRRLGEIGMVWNAHDEYRERGVQHAERYFREHGDLGATSTYITADGFKLGAWLSQIRTRGRESLSERQAARLDGAGMVWNSKRDEQWEPRYGAAKRYFKEHGDLEIPFRYATEDGLLLGRWIDKQRKAPQTGDRLRKLLAIGMTFDRGDPWETRWALAREYFRVNGHLDVPRSYRTDGVWLGKWIAEQRKSRRARQLTDAQVKKLEAIGMKWATITDRTWEVRCQAAEAFYREHGHLRLPLDYAGEDGVSVSPWLYRQKKLLGRGGLDEDKARRLRAIGVTNSPGRPRKAIHGAEEQNTEQISA
jgi:hypothetical protein